METDRLFLAAVLLLVSPGLHCSSVLTGCPEPCTCHSSGLVNCSSSGLFLVPQHIQDSVTDLDLSHNRLDSVTLDQPHLNLKSVWLGNNSITRLSLCVERYPGARTGNIHRWRPWSRRGCVSWAPTLQLLSAERNQLERLPKGLEGSQTLQVLQLSFNKISTLRPGDLRHLLQLRELHLQHNLITSLPPQMLQDLDKLQVLDLSFNKLTSLHPVMYRYLHNILADVKLGGNTWHCDCTMRSLRRWMTYDSSRGRRTWSVVCSSPSIVSGRDLLQLEEDDLNCFSAANEPELHQGVTIYSGSKILLSCSSQDSTWWTPSGQEFVKQPQAGLVISDITERDAGVYVCVSEEQEVVSIFNLQISKVENARRRTRSLTRTSRQIVPHGTPNTFAEQERNQRATQSELALAVCLSIFITFLVAFILGVLARPCVDVLWRRVTEKKSSPENNPVSSVEQRQYDNDAFSNGEEPEVIHRERRVTFSTVELRETSNVQYYDTVASGEQESINEVVIECEDAKAERDTRAAGDSGSENGLRHSGSEENQRDVRGLSGVTDAGCPHNTEYEHIPHPDEPEKRSLSSSSDSSLSGKVRNDNMAQRDHTKPKSAQLAEDCIQQRADPWTETEIEVPQISTEASEIPTLSSKPFSDWSPHTKNPNVTDPDLWQDNEEQFEFSDSVLSESARSSSVCGFISNSKLTVSPASDKKKRGDSSSSSSSSYVSDDEPTEYTVNYDQEEEDIEENHSDAFLKQDAGFQKQIHGGFNQSDHRYVTQSHAMRPKNSFSSHSSDSDGENSKVKRETDREGKDKSICVSHKLSSHIATGEWDTGKEVKPMPLTRWPVLTLSVNSQGKGLDTGAPSLHAAYSSSSSSEREEEEEVKDLKADLNTGRLNEGIKINEQETLSTDLDRQCLPQIKSHSVIKGPSSSSNDSADETMVQKQAEMPVTTLLFQERQTVSYDSDKRWPDLELSPQTTSYRNKKYPSIACKSSSSSDSEDEITRDTVRQGPGRVDIPGLPFKESQAESYGPEMKWPALNLQHNIKIKRRLDIKAPSPPPNSSSSSESDGETSNHINKSEQGQMQKARLPSEVSHTVKKDDQQTLWPAIDLEHTTHIKRRLDIKPTSPVSDSSSSSDSEGETTGQGEKYKPGKAEFEILEAEVLQTKSRYPAKIWPVLDLEHTTRVKRRLDIKPMSPDSGSSSSSDSDGETTGQGEKYKPGKAEFEILEAEVKQTKSHDPDKTWPVLDLEHTTRVKRRLDIKPTSPDSDSPSSGDSEDDTTSHIEKHRQGKVDTDIIETEVLQTKSRYPAKIWPVLDLEHTTRVKRRLDIKPTSPDSGSSSSSDSEGETKGQGEKYKPGKAKFEILEAEVLQTKSNYPDKIWPALDLEHTTRVKRRLDIKPMSPDSGSSSSSDNEGDTTSHIEKHRQGKVDTDIIETEVLQTKSRYPAKIWPVLDLEHTTRVKRRLDIKPMSPDSGSSSSSDSEGETTGQGEKYKPGKAEFEILEAEVLQTKSNYPAKIWPVLDLEHTTRVKRRLDIKPMSPVSGSSSSSDSEGDTTSHIEKHRQGKVDTDIIETEVLQTKSRYPAKIWPVLDLEHTTRVDRRLDIKPMSPDSGSSSSSDSEGETTGQGEKYKPGKAEFEILEAEVKQTKSHDPDKIWPVLDLEHTTRVKRRLDIKPMSPDSDSPSSSDSEDDTTSHIEKHRQGKVDTDIIETEVLQTKSRYPAKIWPVLDLEHTTRVKRRLDIKPMSPDSGSSSSSDSEGETTGQGEKYKPGKAEFEILEAEVKQTKSHDPDKIWPVLDLEHTTRVKRRLDIKQTSPDSGSSSSSDSEGETTGQGEKYKPGKAEFEILEAEVKQTKSHDPDKIWPALDLEHTTRVKRRLDIKPMSPDSGSSSSSDNEGDTTSHIEKHRQGKVDTDIIETEVLQTKSRNPAKIWPVLDLEHTTRVKRRLDIKPTSPDSGSSSSSDSEGETTSHIEKHRQGKVDTDIIETEVLQTKSRYPAKIWPVLDLEHTTRVKRRLDIKPMSPDSGSSSSSDSEGETTGQGEKYKPGKAEFEILEAEVLQTKSNYPAKIWPVLDLEHTTRVKRRLDIKPMSPVSGSSSSSDSEGDTTSHIEKHRQGKVDTDIIETDVLQTKSRYPAKIWPVLDLEHTTRVDRRLDIKPMSPDSGSSSSSDSEGETTGQGEKYKPGKAEFEILEAEVKQTKSNYPDKIWPVLDLEHTTRVKRRLDIKPMSPDSDSPSSSDSEDDTTSHIEKHRQGKVDTDIIETEVLQTKSRYPAKIWPVLDLEHTTRVKRRLDIKPMSPDSGSSSSSDSEGETTGQGEKYKPGKAEFEILEAEVKQTKSHDPDKIWPVLDLEHTTRVKRRLDIKQTSPDSGSSSSSDSEGETTAQGEKYKPGKAEFEILEAEVKQTKSHDPDKIWPVLDLEHTTRVKRRLDIKQTSPDSGTSSSSDSDGETTGQGEKYKPGKAEFEILEAEVKQTKSHDPDKIWPVLDLEHTTRVKRRLDIKPMSPDSGSSSSSDSEDETIHHKERPEWVGITQIPFQESQTASHDSDTRWPAFQIKRCLNVKAASLTAEGKNKDPIKINYHSSRSSDEEEEGVVDLRIPPTTVANPNPKSKWPKLDLSSAPHVVRHLDIRAPAPKPSSSSSENEDGTTDQTDKVEGARTDVETTSHQLGTKLLELKMSNPFIKRRMNIKAPKQPADSDSENESRLSSHTVKHEIDNGDVGIRNHEQQTKTSRDFLYVKRRLDIKTPIPDPSLSSVTPGSQSESNSLTSDGEETTQDHAKLGLGLSAISKVTEKKFIRSPKTSAIHTYHSPKTDHNIKLEKYTAITDDTWDKMTRDNINTTPEINPELESRWSTMNLGISRFRKRLEITSLTRETSNQPSTTPPGSVGSSSSDRGVASPGSRTRRKRRDIGMEGITLTKLSPKAENKPADVSLSLTDKDFGNSVEVYGTFRKDYSIPKTEEKSNSDTMLTGFGTPRFRKYLDIKVSEKSPATPPLQQLHDSSSSSDDEDAPKAHVDRGWSGRSQLSAVTDEGASQIQTSLYTSQAVKIKLDQSQSQTDEDRSSGVALKSQTSKGGEESDTVQLNLSHTHIPKIRRALDIRAPLQGETSSSSSVNETNDLSVPDLSQGVPRVKRSLNIKAPLPVPSDSPSSSSDNENEVTGYTANQSSHESVKAGMTDPESTITYYTRTIFQASSPPSNYFSHSGQTIDHANKRHIRAYMATVAEEGPSQSAGGRSASLPPVKVPSMSFDDVVKKRIELSRRATDIDVPSQIQWTGSSGARRHLDVSLSSAQPLASEDRTARKGLSALKAMSSERHKWDEPDEYLDKGASPGFHDLGPKAETILSNPRSEAIEATNTQPQTQLHISPRSVGKGRAIDILYAIPRYRSHNIGGTEPPQEASPPTPATSPPDESVAFTWRYPKRSQEQGSEITASYLQQSRSIRESDPSAYFDSSNISHV